MCILAGTYIGLDLQPTPLAAAAAGHCSLGPTSLPHQMCPNDPSRCSGVLWDNCEAVPVIPIAPYQPKDRGDGLGACWSGHVSHRHLPLHCILSSYFSVVVELRRQLFPITPVEHFCLLLSVSYVGL